MAALQAKGVYVDCDVDAPNLHLVTSMMSEPTAEDYYGFDKALIDLDLCIGCGDCMTHCRFDAITNQDGTYKVNPYACEGCSVCEAICPVQAISMKKDIAGETQLYDAQTVFSTSTLKIGSGTSGKLVTEVKKALTSGVKENVTKGILNPVHSRCI